MKKAIRHQVVPSSNNSRHLGTIRTHSKVDGAGSESEISVLEVAILSGNEVFCSGTFSFIPELTHAAESPFKNNSSESKTFNPKLKLLIPGGLPLRQIIWSVPGRKSPFRDQNFGTPTNTARSATLCSIARRLAPIWTCAISDYRN